MGKIATVMSEQRILKITFFFHLIAYSGLLVNSLSCLWLGIQCLYQQLCWLLFSCTEKVIWGLDMQIALGEVFLAAQLWLENF